VESLMLLIPEALGKFEPQWKHDYCDYNSCIMEPWDGPALVAFSDGQQFGALLDRNGLRPGRYMITTDDILILSSEVGVVDTPSSMILKKGRVLPGKMILVDFREQRVLYDEEIKKKYALKYPYGKWLEQNAIRLSCLPTEPMTENKIYQYCYGKRELVQTDTICTLDFVKNSHATFETSPRAFQNVNDYGCSIATSKQYDFIKPVSENAYKTLFDIKLTPQQIMFGYTLKRFRVLLCCIFHCPINPLLDDKQQTFLACFSNSHKTPGDYFHQVFAQGTNPSVDPIRETDIMSLVCPIGPQQDLFSITEKHAERIFLNTPILLPQDYQLLINLSKYSTSTIDLTIEISYEGFNLQHALETIREKAAQAVREGCQLLILSDVKAGSNRLPIWCTLAVGAVHLYLIQHGLRLKCAIIVETGEVYQIHQAALLLSTGADAIYPYLVYQTLCEVYFRMTPKVMSLSQLLNSYITYINYGLLQVMSRIGICTMLSYKGGFFFQPMGIATNVLSFCFDAGTAPIGGVDFNIFAKDALAFHIEAYPSSFSSYYPLTKEPNINILQNPLFFAPLDNNDELTHAKVFNSLQQFIQTTSYDTYQHFSKMKNALTDETEIRGQFDFALHCCTPISLDDVESPFEILKRFVFSSSASHWVKKPNIHSSNRFFDTVDLPHPKVINLSDAMKLFTRGIKCIGSTRFSVNPSSLFNANELQIDVGF
jgi:glutamate synthase (NADH)